ncbi:Phosphatidylserine decarboxylase-related domain-containing protein [Paramicrosporidium saccamoebae]|uniref:phosphatidylserine decarboxylase n=1 Tax=Paramicrosporidium saccamoebae TaxID=1246581 RepID=A0A2H9TQC9_9FUNG|nr:Phosphatidylserine decarboxylase-related domain-containing protein [Paramicrosporidium saccamoebae]
MWQRAWKTLGIRRLLSTQASIQKSRPLLKLSLGLAALGYGYYTFDNVRDAMKRQSVYDISPYKLALYRTVPLSFMTTLAGKVAAFKVPVWLRRPFYGAYAKLYDCDMSESAPLESYATFNEFFTRPLHAGLRPVSPDSLVSPADGKILSFGKLDSTTGLYPEQIKGVRYPLRTFVRSESLDQELYYCSVYLAPGSYHRFHSPVDNFKVKKVENIPGEVLPVAPWVMRLIPGLVSLNERAVISGTWKYGNMYMVPVGATNVRSIQLKWPSGVVSDKLKKGDEVGQFEMGSLVVLLFEGPKDLKWSVQPDQWVKYGESLGAEPRRSWSFF